MKVLIQLNEYVSIENAPDNEDEIIVKFEVDLTCNAAARVKMDDLRLALRKMTAK